MTCTVATRVYANKVSISKFAINAGGSGLDDPILHDPRWTDEAEAASGVSRNAFHSRAHKAAFSATGRRELGRVAGGIAGATWDRANS